MWAHRPWVGNFYTSTAKLADYLEQYASVFKTVEGNVTFYGLPSVETVLKWRKSVPVDFRFCFKFPRVLSHDLRLKHAERETTEFLKRLEPLGMNLGPFYLQLPEQFGPNYLGNLEQYLKSLPQDFEYAVEVRHPEFFSDMEIQAELQHRLGELGAHRVIFDTRALFEGKVVDKATEEGRRKKPQLPVPKIACGETPFIRFVGSSDPEKTKPYLAEWIEQVGSWFGEGRSPYFFAHMPDDLLAPELGRSFLSGLKENGVDVSVSPWPVDLEEPPPEQLDLF